MATVQSVIEPAIIKWGFDFLFAPMERGFKVVRINPFTGDLQSATLAGGRARDYHLDLPTDPYENDGPLAIFDKEKDAEIFVEGFNGSGKTNANGIFRIFPCDYLPSPEKALWTWGANWQPLQQCPEGTNLAKRVILRER